MTDISVVENLLEPHSLVILGALPETTLGVEGRADAVLNEGESNEMEVEDQIERSPKTPDLTITRTSANSP